MHQIRWSGMRKNILQFNKLSCFECPFDERCVHDFFLREVDYSSWEAVDGAAGNFSILPLH